MGRSSSLQGRRCYTSAEDDWADRGGARLRRQSFRRRTGRHVCRRFQDGRQGLFFNQHLFYCYRQCLTTIYLVIPNLLLVFLFMTLMLPWWLFNSFYLKKTILFKSSFWGSRLLRCKISFFLTIGRFRCRDLGNFDDLDPRCHRQLHGRHRKGCGRRRQHIQGIDQGKNLNYFIWRI